MLFVFLTWPDAVLFAPLVATGEVMLMGLYNALSVLRLGEYWAFSGVLLRCSWPLFVCCAVASADIDIALGCFPEDDSGDVRSVWVVNCDKFESLPCNLDTLLPKLLCTLTMDSWLAGCDRVG